MITEKTSHYLKSAKTVVVIVCSEKPLEDVYRRGIIPCVVGDDYPGYRIANEIAKKIKIEIVKSGFEAKIAGGISLKTPLI